MKRLREIIQTYVIIIMIAVHVVLVTRIAVDYFGKSQDYAIIKPFYNVSKLLISPLDGMFASDEVVANTMNYEAFFAMFFYTGVGLVFIFLSRILLRLEAAEKIKATVHLVFSLLLSLLLTKFILLLLNAKECIFLNILDALTAVLSFPAALLEGITGELIPEIKVVVAAVILGILWFTVYKVADGMVESLKSKPKRIKKGVPEKLESFKPVPAPKTVQQPAVSQTVQQEVKVTAEAPPVAAPTSAAVTTSQAIPIEIEEVPPVTETPTQTTVPTKVEIQEQPVAQEGKEVVEKEPITKKLGSVFGKIKGKIEDITREEAEEGIKSPFESKAETGKSDKPQESPLAN